MELRHALGGLYLHGGQRPYHGPHDDSQNHYRPAPAPVRRDCRNPRVYPVHQPRERAADESEPTVVHHVFLPRAERVEPVELLGPDVVRAAEVPELPGLEDFRLKAHKARYGIAHVLVGVFEVYRNRYGVAAVGGDFFGRTHRREELDFAGPPGYRVEGELFKVFRAGLPYAQKSGRVHERRGFQKAAPVAVEERSGEVRAVDVAFGRRNGAEAEERFAYRLGFR